MHATQLMKAQPVFPEGLSAASAISAPAKMVRIMGQLENKMPASKKCSAMKTDDCRRVLK